MTPLTQITAQDWQLALGQPGHVVTELEDIAQCLRVILTTPRGSDPLRPHFACDLWRYLDAPIDHAIPHIVREAWDAIQTYEPRVELVRIQPRQGDMPGHVIIAIEWRRAGQAQDALRTDVVLGAGAGGLA